MAHIIHARTIPGGHEFRIWSTVVDAYITEDLSHEEMVEWVTTNDCSGARAHSDRIEERIARAIRTGTSHRIDTPRQDVTVWEQEEDV